MPGHLGTVVTKQPNTVRAPVQNCTLSETLRSTDPHRRVGAATMTVARFFWPFVRPYAAWLLVAAVAIPLFGATTVALVGMTEPVFHDVLQMPGDSADASRRADSPAAVP